MLFSTLIWKTGGLELPGSSLSACKPTSWKNASSIGLQKHHEHSLVSSYLSELAPKSTHKCKFYLMSRRESYKEWSILNSDLSLALEFVFYLNLGLAVESKINQYPEQLPHSKSLSEKMLSFLHNFCTFSSHCLSKLLPGSMTVELFW